MSYKFSEHLQNTILNINKRKTKRSRKSRASKVIERTATSSNRR